MKVETIPLDKVIEHPDNPRGKLRKTDVAGLAASIERHGLLQPIVVAAVNGSFQILAGHRRTAAFRFLGRTEVPAIVRDPSTDETVGRQVLIVDNAQHVPPDVVKEAELVAGLDSELTVEERAAMLGKPVSWVSQRLALAKLSPAWRKILKEKPEKVPLADAPLWLLLEVTKLVPNAQDILLEEWLDIGGLPTRSEVRDAVARMVCSLAGVPWPLDATEIHGAQIPPCVGCEKHSLSVPGLFDTKSDTDIAKAVCRDIACFEMKRRTVIDAELSAIVAKVPDLRVIGLGYTVATDHKDRAVAHWDYVKAKKSDKGAVPVVVVKHDGVGKVSYMKPKRGPAPVMKARPRDPDTGKAMPKSLAERRADFEKRRLVRGLTIVRGVVLGDAKVVVGSETADKKTGRKIDVHEEIPTGKIPSLDFVLHRILRHGTGWGLGERPHKDKKFAGFAFPEESRGVVTEELHSGLWAAVREKIAASITPGSGEAANVTKNRWKEAAAILKNMGLDPTEIFDKIVQDMPEPKGWANLNEDGTPKGSPAAKAKRKTGKKASTKAKKGARG